MSAVAWAAIAASASAVAAFLLFVIERRSYRDSVSPHIALEGWARGAQLLGGEPRDIVKFTDIRNIGRGIAFGVVIGQKTSVRVGERPLYSMSSESHVVLASGEQRTAKHGVIIPVWQNVSGDEGRRHIFVELRILCWDTRRRFRYETIYPVHIFEKSGSVTVADEIAPGVALGPLQTVVKAVWLLQLRGLLQRVWILGRLFRDK